MKEGNSTEHTPSRERLLESGLEIFGLRGFNAVRTRELADAAGVNQSAIPYYFSGKKGLYLAVTQYIIDNSFRDVAVFAGSAVKNIESASTGEAEEVLALILRGFAHGIIGPDEKDAQTLFIAREQLEPTEAFDLLYEQFFEPLHRHISTVVARLIKAGPESEETVMLAHMIIGQVLSFALAKHTFTRRIGADDLDSDKIESIAAMAARNAVNICSVYKKTRQDIP